jgi:hypothetical protein
MTGSGWGAYVKVNMAGSGWGAYDKVDMLGSGWGAYANAYVLSHVSEYASTTSSSH